MPSDDGTKLKCEGSNPRLPNSALEDTLIMNVMCKFSWSIFRFNSFVDIVKSSLFQICLLFFSFKRDFSGKRIWFIDKTCCVKPSKVTTFTHTSSTSSFNLSMTNFLLALQEFSTRNLIGSPFPFQTLSLAEKFSAIFLSEHLGFLKFSLAQTEISLNACNEARLLSSCFLLFFGQ